MDPEDATQSILFQKHMAISDEAPEVPEVENWTWVVAQQRTSIPFEQEVPVVVAQDREVEDPECSWVDGDLKEDAEEPQAADA